MLEDTDKGVVRDTVDIAPCQRVEHYENLLLIQQWALSLYRNLRQKFTESLGNDCAGQEPTDVGPKTILDRRMQVAFPVRVLVMLTQSCDRDA